MSIPKLKKIKSEKKYHDLSLSDEYAWVDQPNILEVLKDANKLDPEVKDYISANNKITEDYFVDVKDLQKNLFQEIKSKIKLDDTSLKFKDKKYYYWAKTEAKGNYGKRIRQLIDGSKPEEVYFDPRPASLVDARTARPCSILRAVLSGGACMRAGGGC